MAWSTAGNEKLGGASQLHDVLLSVSEEGELAFWVLDEGIVNGDGADGTSEWRCTGRVRTGRKGFRKARCSSAKKSALGET